MPPWHESVDARIIRELRLPRLCIGAAVGASLGVAGVLLQTLARNPLVDPYITGVSAGAGLAIALGIATGISQTVLPALGFVSGLLAAISVVFLSLRGGGIDTTRLLLSGLFVSAFLSAIVTIVLTRLESVGAANEILSWLAGSLAGRGWAELLSALPYALVGLLSAAAAAPALNVMRLGKQRADTLGVPVVRTEWIVIFSATLLTSAAVSLSGLVGFVGLLSPHLARRLVGSDVRLVMPLAALLGIGLVLLADIAARTLGQPGELPIGALLSLVGGTGIFHSCAARSSEGRTLGWNWKYAISLMCGVRGACFRTLPFRFNRANVLRSSVQTGREKQPCSAPLQAYWSLREMSCSAEQTFARWQKVKRRKQLAFITAADETGVDDLRVREVVAHGRFAHRSGFFDGFSGHDEAVDLALEETELSQLAEQRFAQLSSGERRRVWIAMGLAQEASLLLLDEPTAHLDLRHTQRILTVLRHLADQGRTVIMALHDLNDAAQYADRIALIDQGRILAFGTPSEVLTEERIFSSYGVRTEILTANDGTLRVFLCRA